MAPRKMVRPRVESDAERAATDEPERVADVAREGNGSEAGSASQAEAAGARGEGDRDGTARGGAPEEGGTQGSPHIRSWVARAVAGHEHAALGGLVGLVVAILVFVIGFWEMLFVSLLVVAGVSLGQYLDGDPKIVNLIRRLLFEGRRS